MLLISASLRASHRWRSFFLFAFRSSTLIAPLPRKYSGVCWRWKPDRQSIIHRNIVVSEFFAVLAHPPAPAKRMLNWSVTYGSHTYPQTPSTLHEVSASCPNRTGWARKFGTQGVGGSGIDKYLKWSGGRESLAALRSMKNVEVVWREMRIIADEECRRLWMARGYRRSTCRQLCSHHLNATRNACVVRSAFIVPRSSSVIK